MSFRGTGYRSPLKYATKEPIMNDKAFERVLSTLSERGLDAIIVSDPFSIDYLTGILIHSGERMCALAVTSDGRRELFTSKLLPL